MNNPAEIVASSRLRVIFAVAAAIMFGLWGWSLVPPIENWGNPNEDGFSYVGVFYATIVCLPIGILLLIGTVAGRGRSIGRARSALIVAAAVILLVLGFMVFAQIANSNDGKIFGVQVGFRLNGLQASVLGLF